MNRTAIHQLVHIPCQEKPPEHEEQNEDTRSWHPTNSKNTPPQHWADSQNQPPEETPHRLVLTKDGDNKRTKHGDN